MQQWCSMITAFVGACDIIASILVIQELLQCIPEQWHQRVWEDPENQPPEYNGGSLHPRTHRRSSAEHQNSSPHQTHQALHTHTYTFHLQGLLLVGLLIKPYTHIHIYTFHLQGLLLVGLLGFRPFVFCNNKVMSCWSLTVRLPWLMFTYLLFYWCFWVWRLSSLLLTTNFKLYRFTQTETILFLHF